MPIATGTRLERLEQLQHRAQHDLRSALRRGVEPWRIADLRELDSKLQVAIKAERRRVHGNRVDQQLRDLGVTAKTVRAWAVEQGLSKATRGRLGAELVEAYIQHHTN